MVFEGDELKPAWGAVLWKSPELRGNACGPEKATMSDPLRFSTGLVVLRGLRVERDSEDTVDVGKIPRPCNSKTL